MESERDGRVPWSTVVGAARSCSRSLWLSSDVPPILLTHVVINLDGRAAAMQRVTAVALRTGNPEVVACLDVVVVRLKTQPFEALKAPAAIVNRPASLLERDSTNASGPNQPPALVLDIHNPTFHVMRVVPPRQALRRRVIKPIPPIASAPGVRRSDLLGPSCSIHT